MSMGWKLRKVGNACYSCIEGAALQFVGNKWDNLWACK
jgi:hypothetical protein